MQSVLGTCMFVAVIKWCFGVFAEWMADQGASALLVCQTVLDSKLVILLPEVQGGRLTCRDGGYLSCNAGCLVQMSCGFRWRLLQCRSTCCKQSFCAVCCKQVFCATEPGLLQGLQVYAQVSVLSRFIWPAAGCNSANGCVQFVSLVAGLIVLVLRLRVWML